MGVVLPAHQLLVRARRSPCEAQKKAFMTTKLGDCGLYNLALLLLCAKVGSFQ